MVPLRVHDGDDASCLNLNRAQTPRLLGVNPEELQSRKAFTFTARLADSWLARQAVDAAGEFRLRRKSRRSATRPRSRGRLHKKIGDTLDYTDEHGKPFKVRLVGAVANSILQGSLIIDRAAFARHFPGEAGYRMFLIDAPPKRARRPSRRRLSGRCGIAAWN